MLCWYHHLHVIFSEGNLKYKKNNWRNSLCIYGASNGGIGFLLLTLLYHILLFPRWESTPWTACSSSCGGGIQSRSVSCVEEDIQGHISPVEEWKCMYTPKMPLVQPCNIFDCPKWLAQEWSPVICFTLMILYFVYWKHIFNAENNSSVSLLN